MAQRQNLISLGVLTILASLVLPFQNCGVPPKSATSSEQSVETSLQALPQLKASQFQQIELQKALMDDGRRDPNTAYYNLDLKSQTAESFDSNRQLVSRYCVDKKVFEEISKLLSSEKFCRTDSSASNQQLCTMVYTPPYATLHNGLDSQLQQSEIETEVKLGEMLDGCGSGLVKLCQNDESLKSLLEQLEKDMSQFECSN
jgi:hypothetical protein